MLLASMPPAAARGDAIVLITLAGLLTAMHALLLALAATRTALAPRARIAAPAGAAAYLAAWFGTAAVVADQTNFPLAHTAWLRPAALATALIPLVLAVGVLLGSRTIRAINAAMPPAWLIRLQVYRVIGVIFLVYLAYDVVPAAFAITAAVGDVLVASLALPLAARLERDGTAAYGWARAWNALGILDLLVVPALAVLGRAPVLTHYPLGAIALFIGPPIGILTHIYSLRNLAATSTRTATAPAPALGGLQTA